MNRREFLEALGAGLGVKALAPLAKLLPTPSPGPLDDTGQWHYGVDPARKASKTFVVFKSCCGYVIDVVGVGVEPNGDLGATLTLTRAPRSDFNALGGDYIELHRMTQLQADILRMSSVVWDPNDQSQNPG